MTTLTQEEINKLLDYDEEPENTIDPDKIFCFGSENDDDLDENEQVRQIQKHRWGKNPFAYLLVIGGGLFIIFLGIGFFYSKTYGAFGKVEQPSTVAQISKPDSENTPYDSTDDLKAKLAISSQEQDLKNAKTIVDNPDIRISNSSSKNLPTTNKSRTNPSSGTVLVRRTPTQSNQTESVTTPVRTTPVRKTLTQSNQSESVRTTPVRRTSSIPSDRTISKNNSSESSSEKNNTIKEWLALASLGSYGDSIENKNESSRLESSEINSKNENQESPKITQSLLLQSPSLNLFIGQSVNGKILTGILLSKSSQNPEQNQFLVQLSQPLKSENNDVIIPADSFILFQVSSVYSGGLFQAIPVKILRKSSSGGIEEIPVNPDSFRLVSPNNEILKAEETKYGGSVGFGELSTMFIIGSLSKIGEVLNRPESSTVSNGSFGSTSTIVNGDANITGAVLEGGFTPLTEQLQRQNEQKIKDLQNSQGSVFVLKTNTPVKLIVTANF